MKVVCIIFLTFDLFVICSSHVHKRSTPDALLQLEYEDCHRWNPKLYEKCLLESGKRERNLDFSQDFLQRVRRDNFDNFVQKYYQNCLLHQKLGENCLTETSQYVDYLKNTMNMPKKWRFHDTNNLS